MSVVGELQKVLESLAELTSPGTTRVALMARTTLIHALQPPYEAAYQRVQEKLADVDLSRQDTLKVSSKKHSVRRRLC